MENANSRDFGYPLKMSPVLIDVAGWKPDDYFATYPEGARDKRAFFPPENCELAFIRGNRRYLFKLSDKRYPEQFWGEIVASRIGHMIGVEVPPAYPAIDSNRGESAALIEWFYVDDETHFIPAGHYMQQMIAGFDMKTGSQHNFEEVRKLCRVLRRNVPNFDGAWLEAWAKGLIFDSLIGNTDRHQNNWGILYEIKKEPVTAGLAPWFDNGTSLGCDRARNKVDKWPDAHFLQYLYNGKHHLRWDRSSTERCGLLEMPRLLVELDGNLRTPMLACVEAVDLPELQTFLEQCHLLPCYIPLTHWRTEFMLRLIERRQALLLAILS